MLSLEKNHTDGKLGIWIFAGVLIVECILAFAFVVLRN